MIATTRWTSADLAVFPDDSGMRFEIIDGELYVSKQPHWYHQYICGRLFRFLDAWNDDTRAGIAITAPGLIFADDDDVAPDLLWMTWATFTAAQRDDGKLHAVPELAVEVWSPGSANEARDRDQKRALYARRGVMEYWIVDWRTRQVEIYRRHNENLVLATTVRDQDTLSSPLLPGFTCLVARLFATPPAAP